MKRKHSKQVEDDKDPDWINVGPGTRPHNFWRVGFLIIAVFSAALTLCGLLMLSLKHLCS